MFTDAPARQIAVKSGVQSGKPWALAIAVGVLVLAVGSGATDNKTFLENLWTHWILWTASATATYLTGTLFKSWQKYNVVTAEPPPPSTPGV
jgi:hypothetical protein